MGYIRRRFREVALGVAAFSLGIGGVALAHEQRVEPLNNGNPIDDYGSVGSDELVKAAVLAGYGADKDPVLGFVSDCFESQGWTVERDDADGLVSAAPPEVFSACLSELRGRATSP